MLPRAVQAAQPNDEVAQSREVLRRVAGADRRGIFAQCDIPHIVDAFDAPVIAAKRLELRRIHLVVRAAADHDFEVLGDGNGFEVMGGAHDEGALDGVGETRLFRGEGKGMHFASLMPTVALVQREVRREKKRLAARWRRGAVD